MLEEYNDIINVKEMCSILHIGRKTAYSLLQSQKIESRRIGRRYKIRKEAIIDFMK